ncbi:MAG: hypothetical protein IT329_14545 [Caldilineaceae bacterium]|nr:hypothetical protein [Caldilineaceae bacterium]
MNAQVDLSSQTVLQASQGSATIVRPRAALEAAAVPPLLWLLGVAALVDWLVTRTLTRFAIFLPKTPAMITGYQILGWVGQVGSALAALLALGTLAWIARAEWRSGRGRRLGGLLAALVGLSLLFLFMPPGRWLLVSDLLVAGVLLILGWRALRRPASLAIQMARLLPVLAMAAALLHQAAPTLYTALQLPGPPWGSAHFFRVGEMLVVACAIALWWAFGSRAEARDWAGALSALPFAAAYLYTPAMTATIVIWSTGLTLFLPWWLYAVALGLAGVAVLRRWRRGDQTTAWAILLLAASGYAPQLSTQLFLGLIALWLLQGPPVDRLPDAPAAR